jgi:hypothetical protein
VTDIRGRLGNLLDGELAQLREASESALAQADAIAQSLEELEGEDKPVQVQGTDEPETSEQSEATN